MFAAFSGLRTLTKTRTNVRLLLDEPASKNPEFTRIVNVILEGTMEVFTLDQIRTLEAGEIFLLPWFVGDMPSKGDSELGEIKMSGNPNLVTTGVIRQDVPGVPFPATLDAAVYQTFEIPGYGTLHNKYPVMIEGRVDSVPPFFTEAKCKDGAILFDGNDTPRGIVGGRSLTLLGPV